MSRNQTITAGRKSWSNVPRSAPRRSPGDLPTQTVVDTVLVDPSVGRKLARDAGEVVDIGSTRVRIIVRGPETLGGFSLIEYPIPPRTLVAPMHRHTWEDEYSFVLEGQMGALLGDETAYAEAGELIFKPRRLWHTIWNPGDAPARILEMISPGGFELFFEELAAALQRPPTDPSRRGELGARYGLDTDFDSVSRLCAEHGLIAPVMDRNESPRIRLGPASPPA